MAEYRELAHLFVLGAPDAVARVQDYIKAGGGRWSTGTVTVAKTFDELDDKIKASSLDDTRIVLLPLNASSPDYEAWIEHSSTLPRTVAVVMSDNQTAMDIAQRNGHPLVMTLQGLNPAQLENMLLAALELEGLKYQRNRVQAMFEMAEERFHDMANLFADWIWEIDADLNLTFSSARKRPAKAASKGAQFADCFLDEEKLRIEDDFAELARNPKPFYERDYWSPDPYGGRICWSVSGLPVMDGAGTLRGFRGVARDISSVKAATDQIYYLVNHDTLTGVMNRQRCQDELVRTLRAAKRENRSGALVLLDIDRFAYVNHTYGHLAGDKMLIHLAQVLKDNIRTGDTVARLDGDQFALILRDVRPEDMDARVERLLSTISSRPLTLESGTLTINVSGGVAMYPQDSDDADTLLAHAINALEHAKLRGPHKVERYSDTHADHAAEVHGQMEWVEMLNECLVNHETRMVLYYQPIVPLSGPAVNERVEHYEVLLRLIDRDGNIIVPGKFMSTAEEFGLVSQIDSLVTSRAIDMLKLWQGQGRKVHLSVNLSGKTFDNKEFLEAIKRSVIEAELPPKALVFEITETALLRDLQLVKGFMTEMRAAGVGFALDDCGVGYSSFNYIRQLELDFIKIDGSFVRNLHLNDDDQAFVKALADVAKQKNISTVAEMVEHEAALLALKAMNIDFAQGFFFAPPAAELPHQGWDDKFVN